MKYITLFALLILVSTQTQAEDTNLNCIKLEGKSIGCFPATDHPCFGRYTNAEEEGVTTETRSCYFYKDLQTHLENNKLGPIPFKCKSWKATSRCGQTSEDPPSDCSPDDCEVPFEPTCTQKCTTCVGDKHEERIELPQIGCNIGSDGSSGSVPPCRERCRDEPFWKGIEYRGCPSSTIEACRRYSPNCSAVTLPPAYVGYLPYDGKINKCNSIDPCPQFVRRTPQGWDETTPGTPGATPVVITGPTTCQPQQPGLPPTPDTGLSCPWMKDFGAVRKNCEPIPECCKWPKIDNYNTKCPNGCKVSN